MSQPIGYFYNSRVNPMPPEVEKWLEHLPMIEKVRVASALLNQCDRAFSAVPTMSVLRPQLDETA